MSFDATRAAWAARRVGGIEGGPRLLVALAMAEMTYTPTGELQAGTRGLAALCGVSHSTVTATQRELEAAGVIECAERGLGTRPTRWRWVLAPPPTASAPLVDNGDQRATSVTLDDHAGNAKGAQRATSVTLARHLGNNYQEPGIYQGDRAGCENEHELPPALRGGVDPAEVPAHVAELREALGGRRGGLSAYSHNGAGPASAPTLSLAELSEFMADEE